MSHSKLLFDPADLPLAVKYKKLIENLSKFPENIPKTGSRPVSRNILLKALIYFYDSLIHGPYN